MLLSWLLPAMTLLAVSFLLALPFTGLAPLWATRAATSILLSAAAALVVLINAAYQDGDNPPGPIRSWSGRIAAFLLTPLAALAGYALYLRVAQYGLTPDRIYAAALLTIGGCYAVAYTLGAFWPRWLKPLEIGNIASAFVVLGVAVALFTPIADPARLSVDNQMARLRSGIVRPDQFDVAFLRFEGAGYGQNALAQLRGDQSSEAARRLAARAQRVASLRNEWEARDERITVPPTVRMYPEGARLPEGFTDKSPYGLSSICARQTCEGFLVDLTGDGRDELVVGINIFFVFTQTSNGEWQQLGTMALTGDQRADMEAGRVRAVPSELSDIMIGDDRVIVQRSGPFIAGSD